MSKYFKLAKGCQSPVCHFCSASEVTDCLTQWFLTWGPQTPKWSADDFKEAARAKGSAKVTVLKLLSKKVQFIEVPVFLNHF